MKPFVSVASAYPFHMYEQASQLNALGYLEALYTCYPKRLVRAVPNERVRTQRRWAVTRRAFGRYSSSVDRALNRKVIAEFDSWCKKQDTSEVTIALSGYASATLELTRKNGGIAFCDRGAVHVAEQERILREEATKWGVSAPWFDPWIVERELRDYETADVILTPSTSVYDSFVGRGVSRDRLLKLPYGVDTRLFRPEPGLEKLRGRIISVGAVGMQKGHHYLAQAYSKVKTDRTTISFVGSVADQWVVDGFVNPLCGPDALLGPVSRAQVAVELNRSEIFCLASIQDGFGLVVSQAMACGLPVVVTERTGAADIVDHGVDGFVVPAGSAEALAEALECLLADPERAQRMGAAGQAKMASYPQWDTYGVNLANEIDRRMLRR